MDRFNLIEMDTPAENAKLAQVRNVKQHNALLDDVQAGAAPRTEAEVKTTTALLRPAGLDWQVEKRPLWMPDAAGKMVKVPDKVAHVRTDTDAYLGTVGTECGIVQNERLAELADAVRGVDDSWAWAQGGPLRGGSRVFMQLRAPARNVGGEILQSNISLFNSHDGSLNFIGGFSDVVIVCQNTFRAAMKDAMMGMRLRHTSKIDERIKTAAALLRKAHEYTEAVDNSILQMMGRRFTPELMEALAVKLVPKDSGRAEKAREALIKAYTSAQGAAEGTVWGAFQAVTNYATHGVTVARTSGRTLEEAHFESNWWGTASDLTAAAWGVLTEEEEVKKLQYVKLVRN